MYPYDLQPGMLLKKSPFLVVKSLDRDSTRVYSKVHGNLTAFAFNVDAVLRLFDTQIDVETAKQEVVRTCPDAPPGIVEELYGKRFIVGARRHADTILAEYIERVTADTEVPRISKVTFLISEACNLACTGCYHNFPAFRNKRMNSELPRKILEGLFPFLQNRGISDLHIAFLGYEPLLNFDALREIYDLADRMSRDHGIKARFKIYTNGFYISEEIYHWIRKTRSNLGIKVSLDGIKADNDKRRVDFDGRGTYDRVLENLKRIVESGTECSVLTVLSKLNLSNIEKFVDEMAAVGIRRITANLFCGQSREERLMELSDSEKIDAIRRMDLQTEKHDIVFDGEWKYAVVQMVTGARFSCPAGMQQLVFSANGDIYPCQRFAGTKIHFGNYTKNFWEALTNRQCESYNNWKTRLNDGIKDKTAEEIDLTGWGCPYLPFLRGKCLNMNLEKELNRYLLDYFVTRPLNRIMAAPSRIPAA